MKKFIIYIFILLCIILILPSLCTKKRKIIEAEVEGEKKEEKNINSSIQNYNYSNFANIKLYHTETSIIEEMPIDEYLYGVVSAEMPVTFEEEALKAQAIVARTYTIYQIIHGNGKHGEADICDDSACCQAWITKEDRLVRWDENLRIANWDKIVNVVNMTSGKIITYNGEPIDAFFHSNSGGKTEMVANVWGGSNYPYLQCVETAGENEYEQYYSEVILKKEELIRKIKEKYPEVRINFDDKNEIKILEYTESGRVKTMKFGNIEIAGTQIRNILGLKSTNFSFVAENNNLKFLVLGYGHGVGMSQTGADSMAKSRKYSRRNNNSFLYWS